ARRGALQGPAARKGGGPVRHPRRGALVPPGRRRGRPGHDRGRPPPPGRGVRDLPLPDRARPARRAGPGRAAPPARPKPDERPGRPIARRGAVLAALAATLLVAGATGAAAHPLGNFTVNTYSGLPGGPHRTSVD